MIAQGAMAFNSPFSLDAYASWRPTDFGHTHFNLGNYSPTKQGCWGVYSSHTRIAKSLHFLSALKWIYI